MAWKISGVWHFNTTHCTKQFQTYGPKQSTKKRIKHKKYGERIVINHTELFKLNFKHGQTIKADRKLRSTDQLKIGFNDDPPNRLLNGTTEEKNFGSQSKGFHIRTNTNNKLIYINFNLTQKLQQLQILKWKRQLTTTTNTEERKRWQWISSTKEIKFPLPFGYSKRDYTRQSSLQNRQQSEAESLGTPKTRQGQRLSNLCRHGVFSQAWWEKTNGVADTSNFGKRTRTIAEKKETRSRGGLQYPRERYHKKHREFSNSASKRKRYHRQKPCIKLESIMWLKIETKGHRRGKELRGSKITLWSI